jgi:hypothetical protein
VTRPNGGLENITNRTLTPEAQRAQLDLVQALNRSAAQRNPENSQLDSVIQSYELPSACRLNCPG